jgi:RNA polymerase sigma-70 factor (ECF subfamily)
MSDHTFDCGPSTPISFERLYQDWFAAVSRWVLALGTRPSDHEDLVQEVFLVAHRRLSHFDGNSTAGWLFQIARRKVLDYRRSSWVQHVQTSTKPAFFDDAEEPASGPLESLETKQKSELLSRRLDKLTPGQRSAFLLFELEGVSGHEIARQQQVPINTVWIRLYSARRKLLAQPARQPRAVRRRSRASRATA